MEETKSMELSVVVPVRNEAGNILPLIQEIHAALHGVFNYEIIYVDDGSSDATPDELSSAQQQFPELKVIRHRNSCGQSASLRTGIRAAEAPWIATLDGDGQNDPADIVPMFKAVQEHARPESVLAIGHRQKRRDTGWRRFSSKVANGVRSRLLNDGVPDTGCGLKVFSRETFLRLPFFDHIHRFLPALVRGMGGEALSVPVHHRPRGSGTSNYGTLDRLWAGIIDLFGVMWLLKRAKNPSIEEHS